MEYSKYLILLAMLSVSPSLHARSDVVDSVKLDGNWGDWGGWQYCPAGSFAAGYSMKVEGRQGDGDDTAVNGIKLYCVNNRGKRVATVTSAVGPWGDWREGASCPGSFLQSAGMKYEAHAKDIDDTATTSLRFKCLNNATVQASGTMKWGTWGAYQKCPDKVIAGKHYITAISGLRTRIEKKQGDGDDTALNGVEYSCSIVVKR